MVSHTRSTLSLLLLSALVLSSSASPETQDFADALDPRSLFDQEVPDHWLPARVPRPHQHGMQKRALGKAWTGTSKLAWAGTSGVGAMQMSVISDDEVLIYDKAENNDLLAKNGKSAWGAIYTISTKKVRALNLVTNSFCAGGGWLSNGTLVSVGGNPRQASNDAATDGLAAIRLFTPCTNKMCDVYENPTRMRLTSARWYASTVRLQDGSILVLGGMIAGGFNNVEATDNPTFEFFPPKGNGLQFYSKFLHAFARGQALNSNLYPITFLLPSGYIFVAANGISMLYDWKTNTERRLPAFPNGVKVTYPASASSVLLPLTIANNWTPEVLICGGTPSTTNIEGEAWKLSSQTMTSKQCVRMVLNSVGIKKKWAVEQMPEARVMGDAIMTPDGKVLLVNGAQTGIAGYGNVGDEVGASNADRPAFRPTLYDPVAAAGKRFSTNFPKSTIERLYHSSATLVPDGRILISGSNPNDQVSTTTYRTRYAVEMLSPPYMAATRPTFSGAPTHILYGKKYALSFTAPKDAKVITAVIMDLGYSTHGVHMNNRLVELVVSRSGGKLTITGPKDSSRYPPGYAWLWVLADGVPSKGKRVMIGSGANPPSSAAASQNLLAKTSG